MAGGMGRVSGWQLLYLCDGPLTVALSLAAHLLASFAARGTRYSWAPGGVRKNKGETKRGKNIERKGHTERERTARAVVIWYIAAPRIFQ
eukprot:1119079-Amorphochlora_amoeboformis.AAC.2